MKAFEVLNGHHVCLAGVGENGVLCTNVAWMGKPGVLGHFWLSVTGLDNAAEEHVRWSVPTIGVGTEITIRVVEAAAVDVPATREPRAKDECDRPAERAEQNAEPRSGDRQ
jgi:hypothetical protein